MRVQGIVKTRSAYVKSPWQFELRQIELPAVPDPGWALIKIEACGVCGTDLNIAKKGAQQWEPFGHEIAGVIEQIGSDCDYLNVGDKVVLESASFCGRCELCHNGRVDLCNKAPSFWGQPAMGFSDYMLAPVCSIIPYEALEPEVACIAEPAGVAYDMVKVANIDLGESVCVVGPGPIGLMAAALAKYRGASKVMVIGLKHNIKRLEIAKQMGLSTLVTEKSWKECADLHRQFDNVLMTAPIELIPPALELLAYGGRLTYVGIGTGDPNISFDANDFHFRKLQLRASFASPALHTPNVLKLIKTGVIPACQIVSHCFGLEGICEAMTCCRDDKENIVKVVIKPGKE